MLPIVNLRYLDTQSVRLKDELSVAELDIETQDEVIRLTRPLEYELEVQRIEKSLLVQGRLYLSLDCQCVRCLRPFQHPLELKGWSRYLPLQGEECVAVVNDCVDLTPYVREDILLEFPRHPLCEPGCRGLPKASISESTNASGSAEAKRELSAWAELDKLEL